MSAASVIDSVSATLPEVPAIALPPRASAQRIRNEVLTASARTVLANGVVDSVHSAAAVVPLIAFTRDASVAAASAPILTWTNAPAVVRDVRNLNVVPPMAIVSLLAGCAERISLADGIIPAVRAMPNVVPAAEKFGSLFES